MVTTGPALDEAPTQVRWAYALSVAGIAAEVVGWALGAFVITPTSWGELRAEMGKSEALVHLAASAGVLLALHALWLFCAYKMRAGRPWARIVLTTAGALCALWLVNNLTLSGLDVSLVAERTHEVLAVVAVLLLYLPASNAHFTARRAQADPRIG